METMPAVINAEVVKTSPEVALLNELGRALGGVKDLAKTSLLSPFMQLIVANLACELLQRWELPVAPERWNHVYDIRTGVTEWQRVKSPIISQSLATTLESIINTTGVITSLTNALGSIGGLKELLSLFAK